MLAGTQLYLTAQSIFLMESGNGKQLKQICASDQMTTFLAQSLWPKNAYYAL